MAIKMRVLYSTGKGKLVTMANILKEEFGLITNAVDKIPPAYSCDKERLVVLVMSLKGDLPEQVKLFCGELSKVRAQNVALIVDGSTEDAEKLVSILKGAGTNVLDNILYVKGGIAFLKGVKDEEKTELLSWAHSIVDSLN